MFAADLGNETELRILEERHTEQLFTLTMANCDHLRQWLPWVDQLRSPDDTRAFIKAGLEQFARGEGFQAGIWYQGELVGVIGYHRIDKANRRAGIGYWLARRFQGRGFVTRACEALVAHAFAGLGLNRVEIHCAVDNARSRAIPERLGFRQEGVLRQVERVGDRFVDHAVYAMLAGEWEERQHPAPGSQQTSSTVE